MVCDKCRYVNKEGAQVCRHCGASLNGDAPRKEHTGVQDDLDTTKVFTIKTQPRATKVSVPGDAPKSVKTINFMEIPSGVKSASQPRSFETEAGEDEELEADIYNEGRRDNVKFIAIIAGLVLFVAAAVIVFLLLLSQPGKNTPADAAVTPPVSQAADPTPTAVQTAGPSPTEDMSSIFTQPSDAITGD